MKNTLKIFPTSNPTKKATAEQDTHLFDTQADHSLSESQREGADELRERNRKVSLPAFSIPNDVRFCPYTNPMVEKLRSNEAVEARQPQSRSAREQSRVFHFHENPENFHFIENFMKISHFH